MNDTKETIEWQSFLPGVLSLLRGEAERALGDGYEEQAEDVVMEAVSRFLSYKDKKYIPNFQSEDSARKYLIKMVRNLAVEHLRNLQIQDENLGALDELIEDTQSQQAIEDKIEAKERLESLRSLAGPLAERERQLMELYASGYTTKEIADTLGEDLRLIHHHLNAVRAKIRYRLLRGGAKSRKSTE